MTAKMGGIDDVVNFPWPAAFDPTTTELDESAVRARQNFGRELVRANAALRAGGAVDEDGHPTSFGKELLRFRGLGSTASALAVMYADRLACVPEVVTILALLEDKQLLGNRGLLHDDFSWPDEWRLEAAERHRALADLCEDDAQLVLLIMAAWERVDNRSTPWDFSERREKWARRWFIRNDVLLDAATTRREILGGLSPSMKEEVKRFVEPALLNRSRGAITRALAGQIYRHLNESIYESVNSRVVLDDPMGDEEQSGGSENVPIVQHHDERIVASLEEFQLTSANATAVVALRRRDARGNNRISNLVCVEDWALPDLENDDQPTGIRDAMRMIVAAAERAPPDPKRDLPIHLMSSWPVGQRVRLSAEPVGLSIDDTTAMIPPFPRPESDEELGELTGRREEQRSRHRRPRLDPDEPEATRGDSDGEINPIGSRRGFMDEDQLDMLAFAESDRRNEVDAGCGHCFPCLDGREEHCEHPADQRGGKESDPLEAWRYRARRGVDVSTSRILLAEEAEERDGWYEVVGYHIDHDGSPQIRVRADWRPEGFRGNPAQHIDVAPGQSIDVIVGPMLKHHSAKLRVFHRVDGQGRFLLRDASDARREVQETRGEIAIGLDRRLRGMLADLIPGERLTATIVPTRVRGCYTITLLELLYEHLGLAAADRGYERHVVDRSDRNAFAHSALQFPSRAALR